MKGGDYNGIQKIIRGCFENLYGSKLENEDLYKFLDI
jgi:hypothetical protein